jgi:2-keto-4-pentenoate hydratase
VADENVQRYLVKTALNLLPLRYGLLALLAGTPLTLLNAAPPPPREVADLAADYLAFREAKPFARPLTMQEALMAQKAFVKHVQPTLGKPVGYKVGLVTREMQERFGVETPVRGVLLDKMLLHSGDPLPPQIGVRPIVEADLVVVVGNKAINKAASIMEVAENLTEVAAFIELPDSFIATNTPLTGAMLTAGNVGARLGVLGKKVSVHATAQFLKALAEMKVTAVDDKGALLGQGQGKAILDHPLNSVLWLMEELHQAGERLKPGDLISLGSIKAFPAPPQTTVTVRYEGLPGGALEAWVKIP